MSEHIRPAKDVDLPALVAIYNHYIEATAITFDLVPFTVDARRAWFASFSSPRHRLLVLEADGEAIGYASSSPLRPKAAYDRSVETTIYLAPDQAGNGRGTRLYQALLDALSTTDVHRCYGVITVPNDPSIRLHQRLGFQQVGRLTETGHKFDRWWDVVWMEKPLPT